MLMTHLREKMNKAQARRRPLASFLLLVCQGRASVCGQKVEKTAECNVVFTRIALSLSLSLGKTNGAQRKETGLKGTVCSEMRSNQATRGLLLQPFPNFCFAIGVPWLEFLPNMELYKSNLDKGIRA